MRLSPGRGHYLVPGCSGKDYVVNLAVLGGEESCSCPDFRRRGDTCKHLTAATLYRAKVQRRRWEEQGAEPSLRRENRRGYVSGPWYGSASVAGPHEHHAGA